MNFVPCLTWVPRGKAKKCPDKLQLSADELKRLVEESKTSVEDCQIEGEDEEWTDVSDNDSDDEADTVQKADVKEPLDNGDEDFDSKYDLDAYDDDDDDRPFMNINDVTVHVDNRDDDYMTEHDAIEEDEKEDEEDFNIKETDNMLVVGHVEEESSVLEVYVYNKEEVTFYVHHDVVLPAYPLALEWLDFNPADAKPGNYIAVGDMTPVIKIWDLDIVDILEPDYCLGEKQKKDKTAVEKIKLARHKDAVISLSWNKHMRNILASGSADASIIIWDLQEGTALNKLKLHSNKVQSMQWHPFESCFLLSGCTDGLLTVYDCRNPDADCKSWKVEGEIERVSWNIFDSLKFFCSTDSGFMHSFDMRNTESEHSVQGHTEGITGLDMSNELPNTLLTGSMDKTIKLWNFENGFKHIKTYKLKVGSIYTAKFTPDSELAVAIGGNNASNSLKVMDLSETLDETDSQWKDKVSIKNEPNVSNSTGKDGMGKGSEKPSGSATGYVPVIFDVKPPKKKFKNNTNSSKTFNRGSNRFNHKIKKEKRN